MAGRDKCVGYPITHQAQPDDMRRSVFAAHRLGRRLVHPNRLRRIYNCYVNPIDGKLRQLGPHLRLGADQDDRAAQLARCQRGAAHWLLRRVVAARRVNDNSHR
jgi:hypothetical protein